MVAQAPLTILYNTIDSSMELAPQNKKNAVINHLYLPSVYSLTMRQLGLYSGLVKCNTNRQSRWVHFSNTAAKS